MRKRLLCSVFLLLSFVSLVGFSAAPKIEHLVWAATPLPVDTFPYELTPSDASVRLDFQSKPILQFDVPPSALSSMLFFECNGSLSYTWSGNIPRRMNGEVDLQIVSPFIPPDVYVVGGLEVCSQYSNNAVEAGETGAARASRYVKLVLRRYNLDWWGVGYTSTGDPYPDAINLLNKLIKKGFTVLVTAKGTIQGVSDMKYIDISIHVTRTAN